MSMTHIESKKNYCLITLFPLLVISCIMQINQRVSPISIERVLVFVVVPCIIISIHILNILITWSSKQDIYKKEEAESNVKSR